MNKLIQTKLDKPQIEILNKLKSHPIWHTSPKDKNYAELIKTCVPLLKEQNIDIKTLDQQLQSNYQTALQWSYNRYTFWKQSSFISIAIALLIFDAYEKTLLSSIALVLAIIQFVRYNKRKDEMLTHQEFNEYTKFAAIVNDINCVVVTNKIKEKL